MEDRGIEGKGVEVKETENAFAKAPDWDPTIDLVMSVVGHMKPRDKDVLFNMLESKYASKYSSIQIMAREIHEHAVKQGFWNVPPESKIPQALMLIVSEASEALEESREMEFVPALIRYDDNRKPVGFATELADIMLRVMDLAEALGIDLNRAIRLKHEYNMTRPYRHGKRF